MIAMMGMGSDDALSLWKLPAIHPPHAVPEPRASDAAWRGGCTARRDREWLLVTGFVSAGLESKWSPTPHW